MSQSDIINSRQIQWFPGHMTKTLMEKEIRNVDCVLQILDARIPLSSLNPEIERITAGKPHLYVLNKADLADPEITKQWLAYFTSAGAGCIAMDSKQRGCATATKSLIEKELSALMERRRNRGMVGAAIRVMIVGIPNVGKSTLISTISAAKPKIANYHFTTLVPTLGVVSVGEGASFVCADIPGLIEGASEGIGLGHDFLRHVERCRLLLHVVDVSGSECRDPIEDFEKINEELAKFSPALAERPQIVVGNKCDLATEEQIETFKNYVEGKGLTFVPISAATMQGVRELPGLVYNRLKDIPAIPVFTAEYKKPEPKANDRAFTIQRMEAHVWSIDAPWLEYILAGSNVDDYESLQYFQRQLSESGILDALVEKGVQENDTILIGEYQFDYIF